MRMTPEGERERVGSKGESERQTAVTHGTARAVQRLPYFLPDFRSCVRTVWLCVDSIEVQPGLLGLAPVCHEVEEEETTLKRLEAGGRVRPLETFAQACDAERHLLRRIRCCGIEPNCGLNERRDRWSTASCGGSRDAASQRNGSSGGRERERERKRRMAKSVA